MSQAYDLLKAWRQDAEAIDAEAALLAFDEEVTRGIRGESGGLQMIPALTLPPGGFPQKTLTTVCIDIGGTRLKSAVATVGENGQLSLSDVKEGPVPGLDGPVTEQEFFKSVCRFAGITSDTQNVAVSFSHNMRVLPGFDGEIIGWCKEITVTEPGVFTVAGLFRRIARNPKMNVRVTNDSVASMLGAAGSALTPGSNDIILGLVNGTGFNICWADPESGTVFNTEAGDSRAFPSGTIDLMLDAKSGVPGEALCEKKVSGVYLGKLISNCIADIPQGKHPVSAAPTGLSLREYCAATDDYTSVFTSEALERSAKIAAICCAALIRRSDPEGTASRVIIGTEGSVINKAPGYKLRFARILKTLDGGRHQIVLVAADLAGLQGAARLMEL